MLIYDHDGQARDSNFRLYLKEWRKNIIGQTTMNLIIFS